jgi:hypothetical protein
MMVVLTQQWWLDRSAEAALIYASQLPDWKNGGKKESEINIRKQSSESSHHDAMVLVNQPENLQVSKGTVKRLRLCSSWRREIFSRLTSYSREGGMGVKG